MLDSRGKSACKRDERKMAPIAGLAAVVVLASVSTTALALPATQRDTERGAGPVLRDVTSEAIKNYTIRRGLKSRTEAAQAARRRIRSLPPGLAAVAPIVGTAVRGKIEIPIITALFKGTAKPPYPVADLQKQLFKGPWPTGTMTEHYREMSGNKFEVSGEVMDWVELQESDVYYSGPPGCNGMCDSSKLGEMLTAALSQLDKTVDFRRFDNDGPDNKANSADDDGFVDFVAFVHSESGGECDDPVNGNNGNIWSHRYSIRDLTGSNFETDDVGQHGTKILVDDYVVMPALACDDKTMIQIGVFSHEFGHAFGLPDLYDSQGTVDSEGVGAWDLMGSGSWGGDGGSSPQSPSHMSTWSKEFLGWVSPLVVEKDVQHVRLRPIRTTGDSVRIDYPAAADPDDTRYLLLEYRRREGMFDRSLTNDGLLVTQINNTRVEGGLRNNSVNGIALDLGVNVIEADGEGDLDRADGNRGDAGDVFPGTSNVTNLDASHPESIKAGLCNIKITPTEVTLDVYTSRTTCPGNLRKAAVAPSSISEGSIVRGQEIVVEGILKNEGTNYFTDRQLVIADESQSEAKLAVTSPLPLESSSTTNAEAAPKKDLSDILGKKIVVRGHIQRQMQRKGGPADVLIIEEFEAVE